MIYVLVYIFAMLGCRFHRTPSLEEIDEKCMKGQIHYAKADIDKYLLEKPMDASAWALLGHIHLALEEDSLAELAFERALKIDEKTLEAWMGMGLLSTDLGYYAEAISYFEEAMKIEPRNAPTYANMANAYLFDKNFKSAIDAGLVAYNLDKRDPIVAGNLSLAYHYAGDIEKRNEFYNIAEKLGYDNPDELLEVFDGKRSLFSNEDIY